MLALGFVYSTVLPWQRGNYHLYDNRNCLVWFEHYGPHVMTRFKMQNLEAPVSHHICCPPSHENKQDPARNLSGTIHQTNGINSRHFHFLPHLMTISEHLRINGSSVMRKIGWLARQPNVMGPEDSPPFVFSPDLTMHLINWLFPFNAVFPAPPVATPRAKAA